MSRIYDLLGAVGKLGIQQWSWRALPQTNGKTKLRGLKKKVEVIRDHWGVPHIYAKNLEDLAFAQGFVHAQDRFWQMELNRRVANGTLSEILGDVALDIDISSRTFGFMRLGKADRKIMPKPLLNLMKCYTKGINAYLKKHEGYLPVEFSILRYTPEPWTVDDSLSFGRFMSWQMSHAWQGQLVRAKIVEALGAQAADELEIHYMRSNPSILMDGVEINLRDNAFLRGGPFSDLTAQGQGSNSWAISPERSTTGHAILANDPHLRMSAPCIWYENHLHCPELHVTGATICGFPLVQIGHNEHISWGITLAFTDCEDVYVEHFKEGSDTEYRFKNRWRKAKVIEESIKVKYQDEPHIERIIETHHGPVISKVVNNPNQKLTLCSLPLKPKQQLIRSWWGVNNAKNWPDFVNALSFMDAPQLNMSYADKKGNIGYYTTGKVPIRKGPSDGRDLLKGHTGEFDWQGYVPFMEMPKLLNPKRGVLVTANNKIVDDDYPHFLGNAWMNGFRARRLEDLIEQKNKVSILDNEQMMLDVYSIPSKDFIALYKDMDASEESDLFKKALYQLQHWDGMLTTDTIGGCIYEVTRYQLLRELLSTSMDDGLINEILGEGFNTAIMGTCEFQGHDLTTLLRILNDENSWWMQQVDSKEELLKKALNNATEWLTQQLGDKLSGWQWGGLHRIIFTHALGVRPPLDRVFNIGPYPYGGDGDTPMAAALVGTDKLPNDKLNAASMRMIVDWSDLSKSKSILPPGQSGNIASANHQDQVPLWLEGKFKPMLWDREQVEHYASNWLVLRKK